jgi:ATP-citrate lyase alpha-subunit
MMLKKSSKNNFMFDNNTNTVFYNTDSKVIQRMLDYEYLVNRPSPSITCCIHPTNSKKFILTYFGNKEYIIPQFNNIAQAKKQFPELNTFLNFASFRSAGQVTLEAIPYFKVIHVVAEGIEERLNRKIKNSKSKDQIIIGPTSVGAITPGVFKIGNIGGTLENIIDSKMTQKGSVGLVTRSGGLFNELAMTIARNSDGIAQGVAIGGEQFACSTFLDILKIYEKDKKIKFNVIVGEVGGDLEIQVADAYKKGILKKPIIAWCIGTCTESMNSQIQFGHGGSYAKSKTETAKYKNQYMLESGIIVPNNFIGLEQSIIDLSKKLRIKPTTLDSEDISNRLRVITSRKKHNFIATISDDRGQETTYNKKTISTYLRSSNPIIKTLTNLWFKKDFEPWCDEFLTAIIVILADHGPAVSGAHNARVTSRAGKDVVSSLATGLLTIGPRFGGAIDKAGNDFYHAVNQNQMPIEFVEEMKKSKMNISGIGHLIKSLHNPDQRVSNLIQIARISFPKLTHLEFALEVEKITIQKKENLILNVDGAIAALLLDMFKGMNFKNSEIEEILDNGTLNAFFIWSRSLGFIGHILEEKRLDLGLYRHPTDDILYI